MYLSMSTTSLIMMQALVLLLLPLVELVTVYAHIMACGSLGLSFLIATQFVEDEGRQVMDMERGQDRVWADLCQLETLKTPIN